MLYQVSRNGQMYGPYTLEDLKRYLASGNVLPTDLAKTEEMTEWVPVSQIVGGGPAAATGFATPGFADPALATYPATYPATPAAAYSGTQYADAPNLHWGLVILFSVLTCCVGMIFMPIWNLVICLWLKRVQPNATAVNYYLGVLGLMVLYLVFGGVAAVSILTHPVVSDAGMGRYGPYLGVRLAIVAAIWVLRLVGRYSERASLQEHFNTVEPIGLALDPIMTFFFGGVYFQYHLNRINAMKMAARMNAGRSY